MIKNLVLILTISLMLTSCLAAKRIGEAVTEPSTSGFVPNLPDVPMPKHFVANANTSSFFDSAEGRIAEINAEGFAEVSDVKDFYDDTLPEFGWTKVSNLVYKKEGELLIITAEKGATLTNIKYQLRPAI